MPEVGLNAPLAKQPLADLRRGDEQHLDGVQRVELRVPTEIHGRHPALPNEGFDVVPVNGLSDSQHGWRTPIADGFRPNVSRHAGAAVESDGQPAVDVSAACSDPRRGVATDGGRAVGCSLAG